MRHAPFALILILSMLLGAPSMAMANEEPPKRCIGWAIPGAVVGLSLGFGAVAGGYALAGRPIGNSAGDVALILAGESVGMTLGPMASCAAFGNEPFVVPAASFAIAGGVLGGTAVGVPLMLLMLDRNGLFFPDSVPPSPLDQLAFITAVTAGIVAGGYGGLKLERWFHGPMDATVMVLPVDKGAALSLSGSF